MDEQSPQLSSLFRPFAAWMKAEIEKAFRQRGIGTRYIDAGSIRGVLPPAFAIPHDLLSASHTDADATDTPIEGDVLTYASGEWTAEPSRVVGVDRIVTAPIAGGFDLVYTASGEILVTEG